MNLAGVTLRLVIAMLCGGMIGLERGRKHRAAGLKTYMLVCIGSALTLLLGQYQHDIAFGAWHDVLGDIGARFDTARYGAQVVNGIGFLGAGTIIITGRKEVIGLTTAAGLWASACMGLAIGAGFYECVLMGLVLIAFSIQGFSPLHRHVVRRSPNVNLYIEFDAMKHLGEIITTIKAQGVRIYDIDIDHGDSKKGIAESAVFYTRIPERMPHEKLLTVLSDLRCIQTIHEM